MNEVIRGRLQLLLVVMAFLAPMLIAIGLFFSGWMPGTRSHGQPIFPQQNVLTQRVRLQNGSLWRWKDSKPRYTLVALPGPDCAERCVAKLDLLHRARIGLNRNADRLRLLYIGLPSRLKRAAPVMADWVEGRDESGWFKRFRPTKPDSLALVLIAPDGVALIDYPAGFEPEGVNKDFKKVFK